MLADNTFMQDLNQYIEINYIEYQDRTEGIISRPMTVYQDIPKGTDLTKNQTMDLQHLLDEIGDSFHKKLFEFIKKIYHLISIFSNA